MKRCSRWLKIGMLVLLAAIILFAAYAFLHLPPSGSSPYEDSRLSYSLSLLISYLEGTAGALCMLAAFFSAIVYAVRLRWKKFAIALFVSLFIFAARSVIGSLFYDDFSRVELYDRAPHTLVMQTVGDNRSMEG